MKLPIRVRMTAWYAILLAVIVAGVGAFLVLRLRTDLTSAIDGSLVPATDQIAIGYHAEGRPEVPDVSSTVLSGERAASQVLDSGGRVIVAYGDPVGRSPMLSAADQRDVLAGRRITRTVQLGPKDERFRLVARAASRRGDPVVVAAGASMAGVDGSVHRVPLADLGPDLAPFEGAASGLIDDEDVYNAAEAIAPDSAAALLIYENRWAAPLATTLRREGAQLVSSGRLPVQAILAALDAAEAA